MIDRIIKQDVSFKTKSLQIIIIKNLLIRFKVKFLSFLKFFNELFVFVLEAGRTVRSCLDFGTAVIPTFEFFAFSDTFHEIDRFPSIS